jgi:hypothetical protein
VLSRRLAESDERARRAPRGTAHLLSLLSRGEREAERRLTPYPAINSRPRWLAASAPLRWTGLLGADVREEEMNGPSSAASRTERARFERRRGRGRRRGC